MESYKSSEHTKCGTSECCRQCDTAKDWYLVSIDAFKKVLFNPLTGERKEVNLKEPKNVG
jgi:hypothetical protein